MNVLAAGDTNLVFHLAATSQSTRQNPLEGVNYLIFTHYVSLVGSKSAESICTTCGSRWKMHSPAAAAAAVTAAENSIKLKMRLSRLATLDFRSHLIPSIQQRAKKCQKPGRSWCSQRGKLTERKICKAKNKF